MPVNPTGRNSHGLYDAPLHFEEMECVRLTLEDLSRQLDAGAFLLSREEARENGLLSPYDEQDVIIVKFEKG